MSTTVRRSRIRTAIVFSDIVGYTAMTAKDEEAALRAVDVQDEIMYPLIRKHDGRVVKRIGDGADRCITFHVNFSCNDCIISYLLEP